ncbi:hypothetical protein B296_00018012 [Ensete ventricosum]|uniref:Uncharacterized protein n=1 Tax=Ensete ventricosum TaxID=4639 RepID=A0A426XAF0_ENSVE|nr:hypothetical protein B296_00018012 [Ensete ventricosum]
MLYFWVAEPHWTHRRFLAYFDHLLQHHCVLLAVLPGRWKERLQLLMRGLRHLVVGLAPILLSLASLVAMFAYSTLSSDLPDSRKRITAYCLLHSLDEHSYINPMSPAFGYLDEKSIDTGLMKFLGIYSSALSWYLEFAFAFSTSLAPCTTNALPL